MNFSVKSLLMSLQNKKMNILILKQQKEEKDIPVVMLFLIMSKLMNILLIFLMIRKIVVMAAVHSGRLVNKSEQLSFASLQSTNDISTFNQSMPVISAKTPLLPPRCP